jgi:hypothetical protein
MREARKEYERRQREYYGDTSDGSEPESLPGDTAADLAARRFSGLAWDADRRVWVQWVDGVPIRDIPT